MPANKVQWLGSTKCNLCHKQCQDDLIDGATQMGPWAVMCTACHMQFGRGLGIGKGQWYERTDGKYFKVQHEQKEAN